MIKNLEKKNDRIQVLFGIQIAYYFNGIYHCFLPPSRIIGVFYGVVRLKFTAIRICKLLATRSDTSCIAIRTFVVVITAY